MYGVLICLSHTLPIANQTNVHQDLYDVFEIRTDSGGHPTEHHAGRFWYRDGAIKILEDCSPDGVQALAPSSPYRLLVPVSQSPKHEPQPISWLRPAVFDYKRLGMDSWHALEYSEGHVLLDGQCLSEAEIEAVLSNLDRGLAELRYRAGLPTQPQIAPTPPTEAPAPINLMKDSRTGLGNLLAYESAVFPVLCVVPRSYRALWRSDPTEAFGLLDALVTVAEPLGGSWYRLAEGTLAREVASDEEAVRLAHELAQQMAGTAVGAAGRGELLCFVLADVEGFKEALTQVAGRFVSGAGLLVGGAFVAL